MNKKLKIFSVIGVGVVAIFGFLLPFIQTPNVCNASTYSNSNAISNTISSYIAYDYKLSNVSLNGFLGANDKPTGISGWNSNFYITDNQIGTGQFALARYFNGLGADFYLSNNGSSFNVNISLFNNNSIFQNYNIIGGVTNGSFTSNPYGDLGSINLSSSKNFNVVINNDNSTTFRFYNNYSGGFATDQYIKLVSGYMLGNTSSTSLPMLNDSNSYSTLYYFEYSIHDFDKPFDCNIYAIRVGTDTITYTDSSSLSSTDYVYNRNYIIFEDFNQNKLKFSYIVNNDSTNYYEFGQNVFASSNSYDNNTYYQMGYTNGYSNGSTDGYNTGSTDGYNTGYNTGYNSGYNDGVNHVLDDEGVYTFDNLLNAVVMVPVNTFTSLFDFDILGVNISSFFFSLLTISFFVAIIKLCLR